jgi:DNA-binding transcriptional ArsR family regulator
MPTVDRLSETFAALADPTPAISKHLKVLERAGLIARGRDAQWRPCRLQAAPLREVATYIDDYRQFWNESFDRLTDYLLHETQSSSTKAKSHARPKHKKR